MRPVLSSRVLKISKLPNRRKVGAMRVMTVARSSTTSPV